MPPLLFCEVFVEIGEKFFRHELSIGKAWVSVFRVALSVFAQNLHIGWGCPHCCFVKFSWKSEKNFSGTNFRSGKPGFPFSELHFSVFVQNLHIGWGCTHCCFVKFSLKSEKIFCGTNFRSGKPGFPFSELHFLVFVQSLHIGWGCTHCLFREVFG